MDDIIEWNVVHEGQLLDAMVGHKPVGVNKYFHMACICDKFSNHLNRDIHPDKIWEHLGTMYNLEALDENEGIPFPNEEMEFVLPEAEFAAIIAKRDEERKAMQKGRETPKMVKEVKKEKEEKIINKHIKETPRRDSRENSRENNKTPTPKREIKKEPEKSKSVNKSRNVNNTPKDEAKFKNRTEETPKATKRPTRGSIKPEDSNSSGKSSPINTPSSAKRRRI